MEPPFLAIKKNVAMAHAPSAESLIIVGPGIFSQK